MSKSDEKRLIPLIEVIHCIQQQLMKSEEERNNMDLPELFEVKEVELEMNFIVEKEFSANGRICRRCRHGGKLFKRASQ